MDKIVKLVIFCCIFGFAKAADDDDWYKTASFYQIYPQTFFDDGKNGRPVETGFGSLKGIEKKLDYLKDLGIDCLWLTPVFKSSEKFNAFGYDITDYEKIDERYGKPEDFENLVKAVHDKKMKIIVDFVPNHCSNEHPDFKDSVANKNDKGDWFVWASMDKEENKPSNWQRIGGGIGTAWNFSPDKTAEEPETTTPTTTEKIEENDEPEDPKAFFYYAQFSETMPDWNLRNQKVKDYMKNVLEFWMEKGVDGFRIDAISHSFEAKPDADGVYKNEEINEEHKDDPNYEGFDLLNHTLTQDQPETFELVYEWRKLIDDYSKTKNVSKKVIMTESYSPPDVIMDFYGKGEKLGAHLPFNFQMITNIKKDSNALIIVNTIDDWMKKIPAGHITNWVIGNHDNSRVATRFGEDRVDIMNILVTMLKGTSVTYYGEEIGMSDACVIYDDNHNNPGRLCTTQGDRDKITDARYRTPMQWNNKTNGGFTDNEKPWIPLNENYPTVNVESQTGKDKSHLEIYRSLMKLRKHEALLNDEKFEIKTLGTNSFGFIRETKDVKKQSVFVLINFGSTTEKVDIKKTFSTTWNKMTVEIASGKSKHEKGHQFNIDSEIELEGYEALVLFYNSSTTFFISKLILVLSIFIHRLFSV